MVRSRLTTRRVSISVALAACASVATGAPVDFDRDVRPIFVEHCVACHGGVQQAGGMSLVSPVGLDGSLLVDRITDADDDLRMPPAEHGRRLSEEEVALIRGWIEAGAEWAAPWAFRKPVAPPTPGGDDDWGRSPIDRFVSRRLRDEGLRPAPETSRAAWLRRVSFDLIGLPPTAAERGEFLADRSAEAHARVVDRLLASPHFGERWASVWLDLVRYADTMGYEKDLHRDIWPYRDWVVRALDDDKPYDEFLLDQLAGDLLPGATLADRLATAMHRNTATNIEGGADDEEFRVAAVVDRVDTTWQALGGLTFGCARCHDHPYDPISQADYYRFLACFNSTRDEDLAEEFPRLVVPDDPARWREAGAVGREFRAARDELHALGVALASDARQWRGVAVDRAESTGSTELALQTVDASINGSAADGVEVVAGGTITDKSRYTLHAPALPGRVTAVRLDALPTDLAAALAHPEMGFVLARLRAFVVRGDAEREIFFQHAFCDDPAPWFDPEDSLGDNPNGWAAYSRMLRPHWAVFVVDEAMDGPVDLREGDRLRLELKHDKALDGQDAIVLRRLRVALSGDAAWSRLAGDGAHRALRARLAELRRRRGEIPGVSVPVMAERPEGAGRPTHRFERGNRLTKAEEVAAGMPEVFAAVWSSAEPARLQMARWIASRENPLTARVWVNRVWATLFGRGIVPTLDDFGSTGAKPTHPELLDHLATRLMDDWGWRLKPMLREITLSAAYRQDSRTGAELRRRDPDNRLLARGPRSRLGAEMIRDQALVLSGRFNAERFGPPVMPYQPEGVWRSVYSTQKWENAADESRFRRALYTYWKKTAAYPSLVAFDAPSRERCQAQRTVTNTPLQALVTMNDPAYLELAKGFAERMLARDGPIEDRIAWACREATGAEPSEASLAALAELYEAAAESAGSAAQAMTVVASAILNLDATLSN